MLPGIAMDSLQDVLENAIEERGVELARLEIPLDIPAIVAGGPDMQTVIVISKRIDNQYEINALVAHELGHIDCGHGNTFRMSASNSAHAEAQADRRAIQIYLSFSRLVQAYKAGCREAWELAEALEIPQQTLMKALEILRGIYGTQEVVCDGYVLCFLPYYIRKLEEDAS